MVWITDIPIRSLSKALGDCKGREQWGGDFNYGMYKKKRAKEIYCYIGSQWYLD